MFHFRSSQLGVAALLALATLTTACGSDSKSAPSAETTAAVTAASTVAVAAETSAAAVEPTVAESTVAAPAGADPVSLLTGGGQAAWFIVERVTNGGKPEMPVCAKDDELIFDTKGVFMSVIGGTQCNPSETEVPNGSYKIGADNASIDFTTPGFNYTAKIIELAETKMVLEFDLGPGFLVRDTFSKR